MEWVQSEFGERLKSAYKARGLTQEKLAEAIGTAQGTISNWKKRQDCTPSIRDIYRVATILNVAPAWLAFGDAAMNAAEGEMVELWRMLTQHERTGFKTMLQSVVDSRPAGMSIRKTKDARIYEPPPAERVGEDPAAYSEPEMNRRRINRRHELFMYHLDFEGRAKQKILGYRGLAAGPGRALERCTEIYYLREANSAANLVFARVQGDSMLDTIRPNEAIILEEFKEPYVLPPIGEGDSHSPINLIRADVPDRSIWIVQINDEEPTLKRIRYDTRAGVDKWTLHIDADNPDAWDSYTMRRSDRLTFWAKFKGLASVSKRE